MFINVSFIKKPNVHPLSTHFPWVFFHSAGCFSRPQMASSSSVSSGRGSAGSAVAGSAGSTWSGDRRGRQRLTLNGFKA